ncbi:sulfatase family protein [Desulforhopalus singaporensis]|uniref:Arylsulfatase A n=1 Tax=Desulforhopalus singaporensis TaxID=91360 RepID=A0A1H0VR46_9BACT|nr:sulfatase [Desulforhopalus singaporensis]SDP80930.1 Arylsulfatase A [Desulforhopalus singaporensis]
MNGFQLSRRHFLKTTAAASLTLLMENSCSAVSEEQPNILFFLTDDQRNDTLGCAGHPSIKTPCIDRLAEDGVRFSNAFVTTPICAASRATIFTGLFERTHKYTFSTPPLQRNHLWESYPALLRNSGYQTGFIGKFGVNVPPDLSVTPLLFDSFTKLNRNPYFHTMPDGSRRHETDLAADHVIGFLNNRKDNKPFCLSVSFNAAHAEDRDKFNQYPSPPSVRGMYEDVRISEPKLSNPEIFNSLPEFLKKSLNRERYFWRWDTPEKYQKNMKSYLRMISGIDNAIGRVVEELEKLHLDKNTVIIFMGDNGYFMGDRGFAGKWCHFDEALRVPLIIYDPRSKITGHQSIVDQLALNVDIAPTILDLANIKIPHRYQGQSLLPLVNDTVPTSWRKDFFCEHLFDHPRIPKWEGVHGERYVYARYFEQEPVFEFLHDLDRDPQELSNYANDKEYQNVLRQMQKRCDQYKRKYVKV